MKGDRSIMRLFIVLFEMVFLFVLLCAGCASVNINERSKDLIIDISEGLPTVGLWRHYLGLVDIDGDGSLDIVAPAPRKAAEAQRRPFIFVLDKTLGKWTEGNYQFPSSVDYNYGGVAVGDINKDGLLDIVLANHEKRVIYLLNKGGGVFAEPVALAEDFKSRVVVMDDINGDGLKDIVSISEFFDPKDKLRTGIMVWINETNSYRTIHINESSGVFGDSIAVGDIDGDGRKDIIVAPQTAIKEQKKVLWFGDGTGGFRNMQTEVFDKLIPWIVKVGDIDGDGTDEMVFIVGGMGAQASVYLRVYKWDNGTLKDISKGLEGIEFPSTFDLSDLDGDGKAEIGVIDGKGIALFKYSNEGWTVLRRYTLHQDDIVGAFDLRMVGQADGSWLFVYNQGNENAAKNGIRAFRGR